MLLVIDIQGFLLQEGFLVKELAISDGKMLNHYIFKPNVPYNKLSSIDKRQIRWLEKNHHSLCYSDGYVNLSELSNILERFVSSDVEVIFTKGHQKAEVLRQHLDKPIINLEYVNDIPKLIPTTTNCCMHHKNKLKNCSVYNVKLLCNKIFGING